MTSTRKEIATRRKAVAQVRAKVGWTRDQWVNELEARLVEAFVVFAKAKLASRNGLRKLASGWMAEFERTLARTQIDMLVHPVKREFERAKAFEEAVGEMIPGTILALRAHVEREFGNVCKVRRGLTDEDVTAFWRQVREVARIFAG